MGTFALIGCGSFGLSMLRTLAEAQHKVIVLDQSKDAVQRAKDLAFKAVVADARDPETLASLGLAEVDAAVVSLGNDRIDASVLSTLHLKELGVRRVVVKAIGEDHARILRALQADEVVLPERDAAVSLARRLASPTIHEVIPLEPGLEIVEMDAPASFVGSTLGELALRQEYAAQVILIRRLVETEEGGRRAAAEGTTAAAAGKTEERSDTPRRQSLFPKASDRLQEGDRLLVLAEEEGLQRLKKLK